MHRILVSRHDEPYVNCWNGVLGRCGRNSYLRASGRLRCRSLKIVIPWYQRLVYRGIDLSGSWEGMFEMKGARYRFDTSLRQSAHLLKGTTTKSKSGSDDDYVHNFKLSGSTWDGWVLLNLESSDRTSLSFGTALLKIYETGERLEGGMFFSRSAHR